jgi:hypothetical protein
MEETLSGYWISNREHDLAGFLVPQGVTRSAMGIVLWKITKIN